jgi:hypothetical protein
MRRIPSVSVLFLFSVLFGLAQACGTTTTIIQTSPTTDSGASTGDDSGSGDDGSPPVSNDGGPTRKDSAPGPDTSGPFVPAGHPAYPAVPNHGAHLTNFKLVTVVASNDSLIADLFTFSDELIASQWYKTVSKDYSLGTPSASVHVTGAALTSGTTMTSSEMENYISTSINDPSAPQQAQPDGNTIYMLYLPDGVDARDQNGVNTNCQLGYNGYHQVYGNGGDTLGFSQRCPSPVPGFSKLQTVTITGSHEIMEAATDPDNAHGWLFGWPPSPPTSSAWAMSPTQGEIGDLCGGTAIPEGNYTYQRIWSVTAAQTQADPCVPALTSPYYNASAPKDWYSVAPGGSVDIPVSGFSTAYVTDWFLDTNVIYPAVSSGFTSKVTSAISATVSGQTYYKINNGKTATLTVTAPSSSGSYAIIAVFSIAGAASQETFHLWPVGVYVQ